MNIIVLMKQTPATESVIQISEDGRSVLTDTVKWIMNPYDEYAVEEAVRIKEAHGGEVVIVSVGTEKSVESIRTALAMGADKGILIQADRVQKYDGLEIAEILASQIRNMSYDLIIAGLRAVDDDGYLVGSAVAEHLSIPGIPVVVKQSIAGDTIQCVCMRDGGEIVLESKLPVLLTAQKGLNEPRYASMPGIMKAKKKPVEIKPLSDVVEAPETYGQSNMKQRCVRIAPERKAGRIIEGETAAQKVTELVRLLKEEENVI